MSFFAVLGLVLFSANLSAQQSPNDPVAPQKFALVIGNGAYANLTPLANPVNDANDIAAVLEYLGFTVDKVLNGTLEQMEDAVTRLKDRLSSADKGYGFFFYAGHGVQSGAENFLIPVNANIPGENYLRNRAMSVQQVLDDLNDARNGLNVVVLDACRDNPFGWNRSGSRGLAIVSRQPSDSIIVYATGAGQKSSDGDGRNGLFTSQLINNLATPGIDVNEIFKRTGGDVAKVSNGQQVPAIYSQFFGTAYLGETPVEFQGVMINPPSATVVIGNAKEYDPSKFWSVGAAAGTCFIEPWMVGTARGTLAPLKYSFLELGLDAGFISGVKDVGYYSFCPFVHTAFFWPFIADKVGAYAGGGGGYMWAKYSFPEADLSQNSFAIDAVAGVNLFNMIDISYTFRTNFKNILNKASVGYSYRFK